MAVSQIALAEQGPTFSRLVLGLWRLVAWQLERAELVGLIQECLELGITTFDHADIYGDYLCEELFGAALELEPSLRGRMQLVTKCGIAPISERRPGRTITHYNTGKEHILASVDNSLRMLRTDYIDLLLIHRPDPFMDADETAAALTMVRQAGKVLHVGVSNFLPSQFELLASRLDFPLVTNQIELSVMHLEPWYDGTLDLCQRLRIVPMAWSPFAGGRLFHEKSEQALRLRKVLQEVAAEHGEASIDQVALAWLLTHPARIAPILGTGNLDRIRRAAEAETMRLSREEWFAIWVASTGHGVP